MSLEEHSHIIDVSLDNVSTVCENTTGHPRPISALTSRSTEREMPVLLLHSIPLHRPLPLQPASFTQLNFLYCKKTVLRQFMRGGPDAAWEYLIELVAWYCQKKAFLSFKASILAAISNQCKHIVACAAVEWTAADSPSQLPMDG